ncbi:hypothetical protein Ddye_002369 [Dipteronia dyeriana]|uniref:Reverse transcriptase domain-containing protein n=1 Tax=Dipteronia dyeriana TaxID=168575 RepID=A0AAD9XQM1_9ROSI|nr:hypothetical protein Ddye_002369 [Dipteronia dyeriana]
MLANKLSIWNMNVVGSIFHKKWRIITRLQGIQKSLWERFRSYLANLEIKLRKEYNRIIKQEEIFWLQNPETFGLRGETEILNSFTLPLWLEGDITSLRALKLITSNYSSLPYLFLVLEESVIDDLNKEVNEEEVRTGLFGIGSLKASGPDGFHTAFFQNQWAVCKSDLVRLVVDSFKNGTFPTSLNQTLIAIVPKVSSPLDTTQLHPISLCNTTYKIISKVVVRRLRDLMSNLISPNQVAFVPGRQIQDNTVVAKEVLHKFKYMQGIGVLKEHATVDLLDECMLLTVDCFMFKEEWKVQQLSFVLSGHIVHRILNIHTGRSCSGLDRKIWKWTQERDFTVKSAYEGQLEADNLSPWS